MSTVSSILDGVDPLTPSLDESHFSCGHCRGLCDSCEAEILEAFPRHELTEEEEAEMYAAFHASESAA